MFREMRRKKNEISNDMAKQLLASSRRGVLAMTGDDGYPYAIPVNYLYDDKAQKIYFHGAKIGHKVDALRACDKVCFTVYGNETGQNGKLGTVHAERCSVRQVPSDGRGFGNNTASKAVCHEILSQRTACR